MKMWMLAVVLLIALSTNAQKLTIEMLDSAKGISLRGVSRPSESVFWASVSKGMVYRCTNGRKGKWLAVPGYEKSDFRGIVALDSNEAWIMAITQPARVLHTTNGGQSWAVVYEDTTKEAFLDAMVGDGKQMMVLGDPLNSNNYLVTNRSGRFERLLSLCLQQYPPAHGEAYFASSNSGLIKHRTDDFTFASGGLRSTLFTECSAQPTRLMQGKETTGANAISLRKKQLLVAGGDFNEPKRNDSCLALFAWKNKQWVFRKTLASTAYNSDVQWVSNNLFLTTSFAHTTLHHQRQGVLATKATGFHALSTARAGTVIAVGGSGRIALIRWE